MEDIHDFNLKNNAADIFEKEIIKDIQDKKYSSAHKYEPNNGDYDVFIDEINEGVEIKNDIEAGHTDNICIEYQQDGRLSGISITKAKYWMQYDQNLLYLALSDDIKDLIRSWLIYHIDLNKLAKKMGESDCSSDDCKIRFDKFYSKSKKKYGEMYDNIKSPISIVNLPNKRLNQGGYYKYMGLYLIPKITFEKYCLEISERRTMTYKKLV